MWATQHALIREERYNCCNISNGIETDIFRVTHPIPTRPKKAIWTASAAKAEDEDDVKGYRRVLQPLKMILEAKGWEVEYLIIHAGAPGLTDEELVAWYNSAAVILCPSTSEGTPNIVLEGAACGCVPVALPVGNIPELFENGKSCVIPEDGRTSCFLDATLYAWENRRRLAEGAFEAVQAANWKDRSEHFYGLFRQLGRGDVPAPFTYMNRNRSPVAAMAGVTC
jgi:glycosyltransferase involved in cell wall biosynthesis